MSTVENDAPPARTTGNAQPLAAFLAVLALVEVASGATQTYFSPVLETIALRFQLSIGTVSWAVTAFLLSTAVTMPVLARLGDVYGHRRILRVEAGIVALGSLLVAVAPNFPVLLTGRILQGMFAAFLPLMFGLVRSRYDHADTRRAVAYLNAIVIFGVVATLVAVTLLVRYADSATWAYWIPAVLMTAGFVALLVKRGTEPLPATGQKVDWSGAALLAAGMTALLLGISKGSSWGWTSDATLGAIIGGVLLLAVWAVVERRIAVPMIDLRFLATPRFLPVYAIGFCIYFAINGGQVAGSTFSAAPHAYLGYGLSMNAFHISMWAAFLSVLALAAVLSTLRLGKVIGLRAVLVLGAGCGVVGFGGLILAHNTLIPYLIFSGFTMLALGFTESSTRIQVVDGLREGEVSIGSGVYELAITLGSAVGSAVLAAIASSNAAKFPGLATEHGYELVWGASGGICLVALLAAAINAIRKDSK